MKYNFVLFIPLALVACSTYSALPYPGRSYVETRYQNCLNDPSCSEETRWDIIQDLAEEMQETQSYMRGMCDGMDHNKECTGIQEKEMEQWHKMHNYMHSMIKSMDPK